MFFVRNKGLVTLKNNWNISNTENSAAVLMRGKHEIEEI